MSEDNFRGWVPSDFMDEVTPPPRPTPDEWIIALDNGLPGLAAPDPEGDPDSSWSKPSALADRQIIKFNSLTDYGEAILCIHDNGTWSVDRLMPPGAEMVSIGFDFLADSVANLVEQLSADAELPSGEHELDYYTWSDAVPFRFDAATGRFHTAPANDA